MDLHEQAKPHHHITAWAIVVLVTIFAATVNTNSAIIVSSEQEGGSDVSERTKKFFNFEDGEDNYVIPAACNKPSAEHEALMAKNEELNRRLLELSNKDVSSYSDEDLATHQEDMNAIQTQMRENSDKFNTLVWGPSDECKIGIVEQMRKQMSTMNSQMDSKLFATLDRVTTTVAKVKTAIGKVTEAVENKALLEKINGNISSIELNVGVLKVFFNKMKTEMSEFLALATTNPVKAFDAMQSFGGGSDDSKAAKAADQLVDSFTNLESNVDNLLNLGSEETN